MLAAQVDLMAAKGRFESEEKSSAAASDETGSQCGGRPMALPKLIEKSVIIHKDENGFGLRIKGQTPVYIEHVHEGGAAWRAGVRAFDSICKVNGIPVNQMEHKDVVLMFKSCSRFVALTLISPEHLLLPGSSQQNLAEQVDLISSLLSSHNRQYSIYSHHPNEDRRPFSHADHLNSTLANDTTSLFAPNDYAIDTSSSLLMDRTRSCRSSGRLHMHRRVSSNAFVSAPLKEFGDNANTNSNNSSQQHPKLNRRDSSEDKNSPPSDKRVAMCTCCQKQQCRNSPAHKHQIQRSLDTGALCEPAQSCDNRAKLEQQQQQQQQQSQLVGDKTELRSGDKSSRIPEPTASQSVARRREANMPGPPAHHLAVKARPVINKRIEIIREFIDTERTHTERLRCLDELFYRPMKQANFMTGEQLRAVFSCHRTLYKIHRQIYRILLSANFDIYSEPLIGSALLEIFEADLKRRLERAACSFCSAQATNVELLNKLTRRDTKVGQFLAQVTSQRMIGRLGIKDLLASCFQRLTKYPLLLENLLKATPQMSPDADEDDDDVDADEVEAERRKSANFLRADRHKLKPARNGESDDDEGADEEEEEVDAEEEAEAVAIRDAAAEARRNSRRMLAISLAEEREFIERALVRSRHILVRVNESIRVAMSRNRLKEIWKRTDKYPGVPLIDITKQQVVHEGLLTLRLSKRSFDVYVLLLNDYLIILTREGQDKYRLKFFTPEGKSGSAGGGGGSSSLGGLASAAIAGGSGLASASAPANSLPAGQAQSAGGQASGSAGLNASASANANVNVNLMPPHQTVYSPVFVIDEHLTTRDAATDENGFYLLCKRKDDSRIYEFASRSPAERLKWRDKIQWTIEHQMSRNNRRPSNCASTLTKSSSETSANGLLANTPPDGANTSRALIGKPVPATSESLNNKNNNNNNNIGPNDKQTADAQLTQQQQQKKFSDEAHHSRSSSRTGGEPTKIVGTISYVIDDGIVMPNKMESSRVFVDQAIQVNILDGVKVSGAAARGQEGGESSASDKLHSQPVNER